MIRSPAASGGLRVLAVTNMYPTSQRPTYGGFIETQMNAVAAAGAHVQVDFINGRRSDREYLKAILRIRRKAQSGAFDVVHAHYGLCGFVCAFQPLPLVVSFWGDDLLGTPSAAGGITIKSQIILSISSIAAHRAEAINCESEEMRSRLRRSRDRAKAHVIPNGVDTRRFHPGDRASSRSRLRLSVDERLIIFPNAPGERRKRLDLAQAATQLLAARGLTCRLWVVQGVPPVEMPDYYRAADCLLLTSDWEGSANVVKEAICCDLPVVSVDAGDARRWTDLTPGCHLVDRNPDAIARGLVAAVGDRHRVDGTRVREELDIPRTAQSILGLYAEAVTRRQEARRDDTTPRSRA